MGEGGRLWKEGLVPGGGKLPYPFLTGIECAVVSLDKNRRQGGG